MNKKNRYSVMIIFIALASVTIIMARAFRVDKIPNGNKFECNACHTNGGGTSRNSFGLDVEARVTPNGNQNFWNASLAALDSDGDGFTNGQELQDPNGTWQPGQPAPGNPALVTNPGDPNSKPAPTAVAADTDVPSAYRLFSNYPNPFNPSTTLSFEIPQTEIVSLKIYNSAGEFIGEVVNNQLPAGKHSVVWNGKDNSGNIVSSGIYYYRIEAGKFDKSGKMILIK